MTLTLTFKLDRNCYGAHARSWDVVKVWLRNKLVVGKRDMSREMVISSFPLTLEKHHRKYFDSVENRSDLLHGYRFHLHSYECVCYSVCICTCACFFIPSMILIVII